MSQNQQLVRENSEFILNLFSEQTVECQSLESVCAHVTKKFPWSEHFNVCLLLTTLIMGGDLSLPGQRVVALAVIFELYKTDMRSNPFISLFVKLLENKSIAPLLVPQEKLFIGQIFGFLTTSAKDVIKKTAKQVMLTEVMEQDVDFDYSSLLAIVSERSADNSAISNATFPALIPDGDGSPPNKSSLKEVIEELMANKFTPLHCTLKASSITLPPPWLLDENELLDMVSEEAVWKNLSNPGFYVPFYDTDCDGLYMLDIMDNEKREKEEKLEKEKQEKRVHARELHNKKNEERRDKVKEKEENKKGKEKIEEKPKPGPVQTENKKVTKDNAEIKEANKIKEVEKDDKKGKHQPEVADENSVLEEAKELTQHAIAGSMNIVQQNRLLAIIDEHPKIIPKLDVTPLRFPELVENSPLVAVHVVQKLIDTPQITDYFSALVEMELSLHSMEVVNRLTTIVEVPAEFLNLYVSNCIFTCENIGDRYMQNRLVRLVCVFLQSLIRNNCIDVKEIFLEMNAFCVEFSRIKEAANLFRLLKQMDVDNTKKEENPVN